MPTVALKLIITICHLFCFNWLCNRNKWAFFWWKISLFVRHLGGVTTQRWCAIFGNRSKQVGEMPLWVWAFLREGNYTGREIDYVACWRTHELSVLQSSTASWPLTPSGFPFRLCSTRAASRTSSSSEVGRDAFSCGTSTPADCCTHSSAGIRLSPLSSRCAPYVLVNSHNKLCAVHILCNARQGFSGADNLLYMLCWGGMGLYKLCIERNCNFEQGETLCWWLTMLVWK